MNRPGHSSAITTIFPHGDTMIPPWLPLGRQYLQSVLSNFSRTTDSLIEIAFEAGMPEPPEKRSLAKWEMCCIPLRTVAY